MRDLLILSIVILGVPVAAVRPFIGILLWCWVSYMNPHRLTWGIAYDFPVAMVIGAGTLLGLMFTKDRERLPLERETIYLILLWITFAGTTIFAFSQQEAWTRLEQISKILLMTFVTMMLVNSRERLRLLLLVITLSIGFFGLKGGISSILTGGSGRVYGPPGSFIEDNNDFALALVMVLPIFFYFAKEEPRAWLRHLLRITGVFSIVAAIFTYSRGGFLGLAAVGVFSLAKSKKKVWAAALLIIAVAIALFLVPQAWFDRMNTIGDLREESAAGRINSWHFAWNLAASRGIFGGGFGTFTEELFLKYAPDPYDFHAAHSIYFEMLGDHGFLGLTLFLGVLFATLGSLQGLKRRYVRWPQLNWVSDYANMLQLCMIGYMISGAFLGRAYFDLHYHLIAATVLLKVISRRDAQVLAEEAEAEAAPDPGLLGPADGRRLSSSP
ncbi:MAG: putative O-glycosylation ligase, exosortase A system-associated [Candidatus Eiseniibacteriota bacterium]